MNIGFIILTTAANANHEVEKVLGYSNTTVVVGRSESLSMCPEGFDFNATEDCCIKEVTEAPALTCSGFGKLVGEECVCRTEVMKTCPRGTRKSGKAGCVLVEEEAAHTDCSYLGEGWWHDLDDDMFCLGTELSAPVKKCMPGATLISGDGSCVRQVSDDTLKQPFCLEGWTVKEDGLCSRMEVVSCDHPDAEPVEEGFMSGTGEGRRLCDDCVEPVKTKDVCHVVDCHQKLTPIVNKRTKDHCERETVVDPRFTCKEGTKQGSSCMVQRSEAGFDDCGDRETIDGQCVTNSRKKAEPFCVDDSWTMRCSSGECICHRSTEVPIVSECPADYFLESSGDECIQVKAPAAYCVSDESFLVNGVCLGVERSGVVYEYTITYQDEGVCAEVECLPKAPKVKKTRVNKTHKEHKDLKIAGP